MIHMAFVCNFWIIFLFRFPSITIFLKDIRQSFSLQNNLKDLDQSYKTDLDLWDCLGRIKRGIVAKLRRTDFVICSHSREKKTLSYSQINMVIVFL